MEQYGDGEVYGSVPSVLCLKTMCLATSSVSMPGKLEHGSLLFNGLGARKWQIGMNCDKISFRQAILSIYPRLRTVVGYHLWFINGEKKFQKLPEKANTPRRIKSFLGPKVADCLVIVPSSVILLMDESLDTRAPMSSNRSCEDEDSSAVLDLRRSCTRCLVCGRTERSADSFHRLQDECSPGSGSGQTVAGKLNQILGFDLRLRRRMEPLVSEEVCRVCWRSVTETVDLELKIKEIKEGVVASFFSTAARFQKQQEAPQQERSIKQEQQRPLEIEQQRYMEEEQRSLEQERRRSIEMEQQRSVEQERRRSIEQERRRSIEQERRRSMEQEQQRSVEQERRRSLERLSEQQDQQEVFIKREPEQSFGRSYTDPSNPTLPYPNHYIPMGYTQHMMFPSLLPNNQVSEINPLSLLALYPGLRFHQTRDEDRITELPTEVNSRYTDSSYASEPGRYSPAPTTVSGSSSTGTRTEENCPKPDQRTEEKEDRRSRSKSPKESGYNSSGSASASSDSPSSVSENESTSSSRSFTHEEEEKRKPMKKRKRAQETENQSYKRLNSE